MHHDVPKKTVFCLNLPASLMASNISSQSDKEDEYHDDI